jgi:hypothetical protein
MGFPVKRRVPQKGGTQVATRRKFSGLGSSDAGYPGTKKELRQAKHRVFAAEPHDVSHTCKACGRKYATTYAAHARKYNHPSARG